MIMMMMIRILIMMMMKMIRRLIMMRMRRRRRRRKIMRIRVMMIRSVARRGGLSVRATPLLNIKKGKVTFNFQKNSFFSLTGIIFNLQTLI